MSRLGLLLGSACLLLGEYSCSFSFNTNSSNTSIGGIHLFGLVALGMGLMLLYGAFQSFIKYRRLRDTPQTSIGSLATGSVHICGKAVGTERLTSPITKVPCFYYRVEVDVWRGGGGRGSSWQRGIVDTRHLKFHLQDETGKVLIDLHQAELDLFQTFSAETGPRDSKKRISDPGPSGGNGPSDGELLQYFSQANARIDAEQAAQHESAIHATMNERSLTLMGPVLPPDVDRRRLRFTEQCLLPDREYNILGTCVENPNPTDEHDCKLILRGPREGNFLISSRAEPVLEEHTNWTTFGLLVLGVVLVSVGVIVFFYN
jgi:hypothetical protein